MICALNVWSAGQKRSVWFVTQVLLKIHLFLDVTPCPFLDVTPCPLINRYRCFEEMQWLLLQRHAVQAAHSPWTVKPWRWRHCFFEIFCSYLPVHTPWYLRIFKNYLKSTPSPPSKFWPNRRIYISIIPTPKKHLFRYLESALCIDVLREKYKTQKWFV